MSTATAPPGRAAWHEHGLVSLPDAARSAGITYRQADYWTSAVDGAPRAAYYDAAGRRVEVEPGDGSGYTRCLTVEQQARLRVIARLVRDIGLPVGRAVKLDDDEATRLLRAVRS